ncbi:hypothetical protein [Glutamicibacter sp. NPDC087344]|uniref:hypothetical protein n=1 Tax=Glutamicibacter sp. NPDC087344 TaxID=3363994 RepID=UPI00380CC62E
MKNKLDYIGFSIPDDMKNLEVVIGWAAKAVNVPSARIRRTGFAGAQSDTLTALQELDEMTEFRRLESLAQHAAAQTSCSFMFFTPGDTENGEPEAITTVRDATMASAMINPRTHQVTAGLEIVDRNNHLLYLPYVTLNLELRGRKWVVADEYATSTRRVRCSPYMWAPELRRPFGSSRINRAVMRHIDRAVRTILRQETNAEFYSAPRGVLEDAHRSAFYDKKGNRIDPMRAIGAIWGIPGYRDVETGDMRTPAFKQLSQASFQPHSELLKSVAMNFHAETDIPLGQLGVVHDNPSSADAIRAAEDGLIAVCVNQKDYYAYSAKRSALSLLSFGKTDKEMQDIEKEMSKIRPKYSNPATPTPGAQADSGSKFVNAFPDLQGSRVALERFGMDSEEIAEIDEFRKQSGQKSILQQALESSAGRPAQQGEAAKTLHPKEELKISAEILGNLRRAGVTAESAAQIAGITGAEFIPGAPVTIRTTEE